jgi:hypothetical protein
MTTAARNFNRSAWRAAAPLLACIVLLTGCPAPRRAPDSAPPAVSPAPAAAKDAQVFQIDPAQSLIQILAMRGGALARLGHNHVIAARGLAGEVYRSPELTDSRFELRLPVREWTVDDPALRAGRGADFPPEVPESARSGTRQNMLSSALLDAEQYPQIVVRGDALSGGPEQFDLRLNIALGGRQYEVAAPASIRMTADRIEARGQLQLRQTALGLAPFAVMLGALTVEDVLTVEYSIVALPR